MQCEQVQSKLTGFLDGELRVQEHLCVQVHLTRCYHCKEAVEEFESFLQLFQETTSHPNPRNRFDELWPEICRFEDSNPGRGLAFSVRSRKRLRPWAAAAALVFVCIVLLFPIGGDAGGQGGRVEGLDTADFSVHRAFEERRREIVKGAEGLRGVSTTPDSAVGVSASAPDYGAF